MNRLDFLHQLYLSLEGVPEPDRRNLLRDFEAHFQLAQQEGRTEEDTAAALGDPKRIAEDLKIHYHSSSGFSRFNQAPPPNWAPMGPPQPRRSNRKLVGVVLIAAGVFVLVVSLLFFPFVFSVRTDSASRMASGIREVAADLVYELDETASAQVAAFEKIEIQVVSEDVGISLDSGQDVVAHLQGTVTTTTPTAVPKLVKEEQGNTLILRIVQQTGSIGFYTSNATLSVSIPESWTGELIVTGSSADITLPEASFASLTLRTVSGDMDVGTVAIGNAFALESSSGNVSIDSATCASFRVTTVSGDLSADNVNTGSTVDMATSSGRFEVSNLVGKNIRITSVSGDISLEDVAADMVAVKGSSSSVDFRNMEGDLEIKTVSGDIKLDGLAPKVYTRVESSSGRVQAGFLDGIGLNVDVKSSSGSMEGSLSLSDGSRNEHSWNGTRGDGKVEVTIQTVSGDVILD